MSVGMHCRRDPVTARADESVRDAAKRMRELAVGSLVIVSDEGKPIGMVTDRDIVQRVLRRHGDPDTTPLSRIMNEDLTTIWQGAPLVRAFHRMRQEGVRRVLVTGDGGELAGILSFDDAIPLIAKELGLAADVLRSQMPAQQATES